MIIGIQDGEGSFRSHLCHFYCFVISLYLLVCGQRGLEKTHVSTYRWVVIDDICICKYDVDQLFWIVLIFIVCSMVLYPFGVFMMVLALYDYMCF